MTTLTHASTNSQWDSPACPLISASKTMHVNSVHFSSLTLLCTRLNVTHQGRRPQQHDMTRCDPPATLISIYTTSLNRWHHDDDTMQVHRCVHNPCAPRPGQAIWMPNPSDDMYRLVATGRKGGGWSLVIEPPPLPPPS